MRPVCLLMESGFYLVFIISIIKWKVLVNKFLKVYLSVRTSLCSADNASLMLVHFFSIKGEIFRNSLSNLGTDILYILYSVSSPDKEYKTLLCLISAHSRDEPTSLSL